MSFDDNLYIKLNIYFEHQIQIFVILPEKTHNFVEPVQKQVELFEKWQVVQGG